MNKRAYWIVPVLLLAAVLFSAAFSFSAGGTDGLTRLAAYQGAKLKGTVGYQLRKVDDYLDKVERSINFKGPVKSRYEAAKGYLEAADREHKQILDYEMGKFDANHLHYVSVVNRLERLRAQVNALGREAAQNTGASANVGAQTGGGPPAMNEELGRYGLPFRLEATLERIENASRDVIKMANQGMNAQYVQSGANFQGQGEQIKDRLRGALDEWVQANKTYAGKFDRNNPRFQEVRGKLARAREAANNFYQYHGLYGHKPSRAVQAALKPPWHYQTQGVTSQVHRNNAGRIVWSKQIIQFRAQESAKLENTFRLTDNIYGRVYLTDSLRNTPVFSSADRRPQENTRNEFEIRLLIDGRNVPISFGVFHQNRFGDQQAKNWTTWQFSPNLPKPDQGMEQAVVSAWQKATRNLPAGNHQVRFEWWGTLGQFRTRAPLAVGEFTLAVGQGEQLAVTGSFPADVYRGSDLGQLKRQMTQALVGPVTRNPAEIKRVAVTGNWRHQRYSDTKRPYRMITGAILWADKDGDGVCRYTSYNFVSDSRGNGVWTPLRYRSFCNGCPEGEVKCP